MLSSDDVSQIIAMAKDGLSNHQIADATGLSVRTIYAITKTQKKKLPEPDIIRAYLAGDNLVELATKYKTTIYMVQQVLVRNGVYVSQRQKIMDAVAKVKGSAYTNLREACAEAGISVATYRKWENSI